MQGAGWQALWHTAVPCNWQRLRGAATACHVSLFATLQQWQHATPPPPCAANVSCKPHLSHENVVARNRVCLHHHQLDTLELVARARHEGAVSADTATALGIQHKNFFYVTRMLEVRGLITRTKLMVPDGKGNSGWTTTSLIHLPRFAPRLALGSEAIVRVR